LAAREFGSTPANILRSGDEVRRNAITGAPGLDFADEHRAHSRGAPAENIGLAVADHPRLRWIHLKFPHGSQQKIRRRFSARACA
jgi:hypothetical protein